jgi:NodT family efflux transporter outer membrane factor (OMF) lipoprotein
MSEESHMKAKLLAGLALLLSAGCKVGPDFTPPRPAAMPSAWSNSAGTAQPAELEQWWNSLGDPTLTALVQEALKANLSLASAEANLRQARALRGVAVGGLWPTATASASASRQGGPQYNSGGGAGNLFQAGLDATWELDVFGGARRNLEAATANVQAATENLRDVQVSVVAEVALAYVQLRGYQQEIVTAQANLEIQQHTVDITRKLHQVGFDSGLDLANAEETVAATEAQIPVFATGARQSIHALSVLLAREPGYLVERLSPTGDLPPLPPRIPAGLPSDLLRRRPDIRQAEAQLHSATAQIGVATAQLYPQFSLTGGVGLESSQASNLLHRASRSFFVGPAASWPLFQGGAIISSIHAQEALRDVAFITYQQTVLTALQDVENALVAFDQEQKHYKSLGDAVAADHKAVDLSMRLFQEGQINFLSVITAQRTLYADDSTLTQSRESLGADVIALYKAMGGGWPSGIKQEKITS